MYRPRIAGILALAISVSTTPVWGAQADVDGKAVAEGAPPTSNMESWQADEGRRDNWTWFGMGYESRRAASPVGGTNTTTGNTAGGTGKGAPGGRKP